MSSFFELFLSSGGRAAAAVVARLAEVASRLPKRRRWHVRSRESAAPPIFIGDNRMRRDLGLPPVDRYGRPI